MDNTNLPYISIVVPAYNESDKISATVEKIYNFFKTFGKPFELIVVDDASKDNTFSIVQSLITKYPELKAIKLEKNTRKSGAVKEGLLQSQGQFVLSTDADLATSIDQAELLLNYVANSGYAIAIGSRGLKSSKLLASQSYFRRMLGKLYGRLVNILLIQGVVDTQCGFKLYRREIITEILPKLTSQLSVFEIEILMIATKLGYKIAEVPVTWSHNKDTRLKYNIVSSLKVFAELLRLKYIWRVLIPYKIIN